VKVLGEIQKGAEDCKHFRVPLWIPIRLLDSLLFPYVNIFTYCDGGEIFIELMANKMMFM